MLALPGRGLVPLDTPLLHADDLGVLRGDGVFETLLVRDGRPWLLDEHLLRMARSAARLDLALPEVGTLRELAATAVDGWRGDGGASAEGVLRLVCTRGRERGGAPTVYALVTPLAPVILDQRRAGVRVSTATLGVPADLRADAPWLLGGVKSLSYAMNMAVLRWAAAEGQDDVLLTALDGHVLEGPTATVVWLDGGTLCTVPTTTGILPGTTARHLLGSAGAAGFAAADCAATVDDLHRADGVWLCSSVRGVVAVTAIDSKPCREDAATTAALRAAIGLG